MLDINKNIKSIRLEKGMSQAELAEKTYTTKSTVSKWESGSITPSVDVLKVIAKALGVGLYKIMGESLPWYKTFVNALGRLALWILAWIHIDITFGAVVTSLGIAFAVIAPLVGVGGGITLSILNSIWNNWNILQIMYVVSMILCAPIFLVVFSAVAYLYLNIGRWVYNFSFKFFWGIQFRIPEIKKPKINKQIKIVLLIVGLIGVVFMVTTVILIPTMYNNNWDMFSLTHK